MKLVVDYAKCQKSGQCFYMFADLVARGNRDLPKLLVDNITADQVEDAKDLVDICPAGAISLEDNPTS